MDETTDVVERAPAATPLAGAPVYHNSGVCPPARRRLRTFAFDPMSTRLTGRFLTLNIPFEQNLKPGPDGGLVQVVDYDASREVWYEPVDLNDPYLLAQDGIRPTESDPRAHQQVVYAVTMSVLERFERFMGRRFRWHREQVLRLVPHAFEGQNAYFDPKRRAVLFGYYRADTENPGANLPSQIIFTCLSSDIIAHEVTHAIVHRIRRRYSESTHRDVFAWHEAVADLMALFQHFTHRDVVLDAIATTAGELENSSGLLELAKEFGESTGRGAALRSAIADKNRTPMQFLAAQEPHELGACFVAAVFDAYLDAYQNAIADLLRIASGGTGVLPPGRLHPDLVSRIADEAVKTADRILGMVVRAFDYLPVVDVRFGDVVRAIVTADRGLYPEDEQHLRSTLVEALRRRGIWPTSVTSLTDEALVWHQPDSGLNITNSQPRVDLPTIILSASKDLDPIGQAGDIRTQPTPEGNGASDPNDYQLSNPLFEKVAKAITRWAHSNALQLGLDPNDKFKISCEGIHVSYRRAGDRLPRPEVAIQLLQRRPDLEDPSQAKPPAIRAGTALVISADGRVAYVIAKPLPLSSSPAKDDKVATAFHNAGVQRLKEMKEWFARVEADDPLSAWTSEHAIHRLDFASIHSQTGE
ncbi:hypothetical protein GFY24_26175 [Nocardia sp. SYP-A9097]|uniref:hypothetical protein n=1 Tax=Nocardia sp. SYP-A9097 TaxID=2663237 RepID=UPI00129A7398|nr:hypothetical protein [Nocardia sp. SYP-A9097]MRH90884.1 hypothetical protein [Nocardia sp. SYP-A9097]